MYFTFQVCHLWLVRQWIQSHSSRCSKIFTSALRSTYMRIEDFGAADAEQYNGLRYIKWSFLSVPSPPKSQVRLCYWTLDCGLKKMADRLDMIFDHHHSKWWPSRWFAHWRVSYEKYVFLADITRPGRHYFKFVSSLFHRTPILQPRTKIILAEKLNHRLNTQTGPY